MSKEYPAIEGGGSLILAWQIKNKKVLVVGGGEVGFLKPAAIDSLYELSDGLTMFLFKVRSQQDEYSTS